MVGMKVDTVTRVLQDARIVYEPGRSVGAYKAHDCLAAESAR